MDALDQVGGTPPSLWLSGVIADALDQNRNHHRIAALVRQIEKLSWMLELMDQEPGITLEGAEYQWHHARASLR